MNGNERIGAESLFEPAFDIDGQLMGAEHAHPTIDADMEEYVLGTDEITYTDSAYSPQMMTSVAYQ